mmetsp:Transcript_75922/g.178162  ORF Transcript_75922/g.178162 Transcript_75922/m.178162 type:complete len:212 (+) Transcript_75922:311-946(+)
MVLLAEKSVCWEFVLQLLHHLVCDVRDKLHGIKSWSSRLVVADEHGVAHARCLEERNSSAEHGAGVAEPCTDVLQRRFDDFQCFAVHAGSGAGRALPLRKIVVHDVEVHGHLEHRPCWRTLQLGEAVKHCLQCLICGEGKRAIALQVVDGLDDGLASVVDSCQLQEQLLNERVVVQHLKHLVPRSRRGVACCWCTVEPRPDRAESEDNDLV